jgi:hypothetical protein
MAPDFFVTVNIAAAQFSGADSGITVFTVPEDTGPLAFLGATAVWDTAGTNNIRVKKILAGEVDAPGAAADASNVDLTEVIDLTADANVPVDVLPITEDAVNFLYAGDRVALASDDGVATLAGGVVHLRFVWL